MRVSKNRLVSALSVAATVTGALAWCEAQSNSPGGKILAVQFKKEHAFFGVCMGILMLVG